MSEWRALETELSERGHLDANAEVLQNMAIALQPPTLTAKEQESVLRLSFLWDSYSLDYRYGEVLLLFSKLVQTSIAPLLFADSPPKQLLTITLGTFLFLMVQMSLAPFRFAQDDVLSAFVQTCVFFVAFGALLGSSEVVTAADNVEEARQALGYFIVIVVFCIPAAGVEEMLRLSWLIYRSYRRDVTTVAQAFGSAGGPSVGSEVAMRFETTPGRVARLNRRQ